MIKYVIIPILVILAIIVVRMSLYTVDAAEYVYVTVLGQHRETFDGADQANGAGLKVGWPWPIQQAQRLDRRLQQFDLAEMEQLTHDPEGKTVDKNLFVEAYVCWKIADKESVERFVTSVGTAARARDLLAPRINSQLGAAIGQMRMDDLVTEAIDPATGKHVADLSAEKLRTQLLAELQGPVRKEYGIELTDIRLRRFNHPARVQDSIFARIRSERSKIATRYESDGNLRAANIASETEEKVRNMLAEARAAEEKVKADADTEAVKIRNQAHSQNPEFYAFLKQMETMQSIFGDAKTMLLLSTNRPIFKALFQPPHGKAEATVPDKKGAK